MKDFLGKAVVDGVLKYASVSAVKTFDPRTKGGCPRRWHKRYIEGVREPESDNMREAKEAGIALDTEVKNYLRTGERALSALAIKGLHILPKPGGGLGLDVPVHQVDYLHPDGTPYKYPEGIEGRLPAGVQVLVRSALTAAGIPFVGELDFVHGRGHYVDDDGETYDDPPETVEVGDLKYKTNAKDRHGNSNFLLPSDLARDIQMAGYGEWVGRVRPATQHVRLSHLYFPKKGDLPTKVTKLHVLDDCRRTWEYVDGVVRMMSDVAKETDIERVPGADRATSCDAYGGCPYRESCSAYRRSSLDALYNKVADDHLKEQQMGLVANGGFMTQQPAQAALNASAPVTQQQQLAQEEQQMRAQVAQQQAQMPTQWNPVDFLTMTTRLGAYGIGFPKLVGNAAQAYAMAGGQNVAPGFEFQGVMAPPGAPHSLHATTISEWQHVYQLERDVAAKLGPMQAPVQAPVQAPPAPPPFAFTPPAASSVLPPGAPESRPELAQARPPEFAPAQPVAEKPEKKRGRPAKDQGAAPEAAGGQASAQTAAANVPPPSTNAATQVTPAAVPALNETAARAAITAGAGIVLINARGSVSTKSLAGYVDYINAELSKRYSVTADGKPGIQDVRCVPKDSPLAFGGWKGAVREVVKADPPPPGDYHLDTFMDELNEVVADALRIVAEQKGWLYFRGVR